MNSEISTDVEDNSEESIDNSEQIKNLPLKTFLILLERKLKKYFPLQNSDGEETVESKFIRITCTSCRHLLESTDVYNQDKPINIAFAEEDVSKAQSIVEQLREIANDTYDGQELINAKTEDQKQSLQKLNAAFQLIFDKLEECIDAHVIDGEETIKAATLNPSNFRIGRVKHTGDGKIQL